MRRWYELADQLDALAKDIRERQNVVWCIRRPGMGHADIISADLHNAKLRAEAMYRRAKDDPLAAFTWEYNASTEVHRMFRDNNAVSGRPFDVEAGYTIIRRVLFDA